MYELLSLYMKLSKLIIPEFLLVSFITTAIGTHLISISVDTMNMLIAIMGLMCLLYYLICGNKTIKLNGLVIGVVMSFFMLISILYNGNARTINILWVWSYIGVAMLLYQYGLRPSIAIILFYVGCLFFVNQALTEDIAASELLSEGSENNISTLCVFLMIILYLSFIRIVKSKIISYLPIILVLFISLWTACRAAILTMGLFLIFAFIHNMKQGGLSLRNIVIALTIVVSLIYFYKNYFDEFGIALLDKMDRYGGESERTFIWSDYLNGISQNFANFLFGVKGTDPQYRHLSYYAGNTHNAFLMLHSKFGIGGFFIIIWYLFVGIMKAIKAKQYVFISLLFVVVLRSMFDWTAFPGLLDVIFYFYVIYALDKTMYWKNYVS